jgi:hypothetical protein
VNQDTVNKGRRGNRKQCVTAANAAVQTGRHIVVDRCNLSVEQVCACMG